MKQCKFERRDIGNQAQKILKSVKKTSSADVKANAALALSLLGLSVDAEDNLAKQVLRLIKDLGY